MSHRIPAPVITLLVVVQIGCGDPPPEEASTAGVPQEGATTAEPGTPEWKIESAMSAAPGRIAQGATLMDWPAEEGGAPTELRPGTTAWVCFPDIPATEPNDPMCVDGTWQAWLNAWTSRTEPAVDGIGIAYMLQGDAGASNIDPFATGPTRDNEWIVSGPHLMLLTPDPADLAGIPTEPGSGPYVMWRNTPYAHVMVPVDPD